MSECLHERIDTYRFIDTGEPCGLWACAECKKKFIPAESLIAIEKQRDELLAALDTVLDAVGALTKRYELQGYGLSEDEIEKVFSVRDSAKVKP